MEIIVTGVLVIVAIIGLFILSNWLLGYRKNHIVIDFDERFFDQDSFVKAIRQDLESQGRDVKYEGSGRFFIDGKKYLFIERNVSMGGVPMQRAILKPEK